MESCLSCINPSISSSSVSYFWYTYHVIMCDIRVLSVLIEAFTMKRSENSVHVILRFQVPCKFNVQYCEILYLFDQLGMLHKKQWRRQYWPFVRGSSYLSLTRSISWLLIPWLLTSPGHQQPCYWLCRICRSRSYLRKDFKYLCHINVELWHKM